MSFDEVVLRDKERRLSISRIPKNVKEDFTAFADEEFCSDFGLCFKWCYDEAMEYKKLKNVLLNGELIKVISQLNSEEEKGRNTQNSEKGGEK